MIRLTDLPPAPVTTRKAMEVEVDGEAIGTVEPYCEDEWHASIMLPTKIFYPGHVLIQGFAKTPYEAISTAVTDGIDQHEQALAAIREFQARLQEQKPA